MWYGKDGWAISMNTGMWSGINMICPDLSTSTKSFFSFFTFFYFNLAHLFYGGGQVALESIEIICKPNFPLNISLYKLEMDSSPCFCHILLKCRIGTEQLQWILGKTGTTDLGIHTKEKASPKENVKRKITTKENIKGKLNVSKVWHKLLEWGQNRHIKVEYVSYVLLFQCFFKYFLRVRRWLFL